MPVILTGELTADQYEAGGASFPADRNTRQITFLGTGAPYYARFFKINPSDPIGQPVLDGVERLYPAGSGDSLAANIGGVEFRSAVPGVPAAIYGQQAFATDVISATPAFGGGTQACCGGSGGSLDVTDGVVDVNPTTQIVIGAGLTLTNPAPGVAHLEGDGGIQFTADGVYGPANSGDALEIKVTGPGFTSNGYGIEIVDNSPTGGGLSHPGGIDIFSDRSGSTVEVKIGVTPGVLEMDAEETFELSASGSGTSKIDPSGPLEVSSQNELTLKAGEADPSGGDLVLDTSAAGVSNAIVNLRRSGNTFVVNDHLGSPLLTLTG